MQLDPNKHLVSQLQHVSGTTLERLTAATFASVGYTVFRNLKFELGGQTAAEADVFAAVFTPLRESRILLECKGGDPSFTEIREFASLRHLLWPEPDDLIIICRGNCPGNRQQLATHLKVRLIEKPNLVYYVLPLLGGAALRQARAKELNRYLAWQTVHEFFVARVGSHHQLNRHYRFLTSDLWKVGDPEQQVTLSFQAYSTTFPNTTQVVAQAHGTTANAALYTATDDDIEASMYIELMHRVINVYAVVRRTLQLIQHFGVPQLIATMGSNLRLAVADLSGKPRYLFGFPAFFQTFLYVWGGFLVDAHRDWEVARMSEEAGVTTEAGELYLRILASIYTGTGTAMFGAWNGFTYFKYVPGAVRALGVQHRQAIDPGRYAGTAFFGAVGAAHQAALDRALGAIGGTAALRYV